MENFEFYNPVRIIFGSGEVSKTGVEASKIGLKALLVSYKEHDFLKELLSKLESILQDAGVKVVPFFEVTANPRMCQIREYRPYHWRWWGKCHGCCKSHCSRCFL